MAKPKKPLTNVQLVTKMMEFSEVGAIKQAFIIEAIRVYSKNIIESPPWPDTAFISHAAWKKAAEECVKDIDGRLS